MKPVILFSLPRSGSTILCGLLSQHDDFKVIEGSLSIGISNAIRNVFYNNAKSLATNQQKECLKVLKGSLHSYLYSHNQFVFDKNREWLFYLDMADQVFDDYKVVVLVRDPVECVASFLRLKEKEPITYTAYETDLVKQELYPTTLGLVEEFMSYKGAIGRTYTALYEASVIQQRAKNFLFIDYHKLCANPQKELNKLCDYIGASAFNFQTNNIQNANKQLDRHYGMYDTMHTIEKEMRSGRTDLGRVEPFANNLRERYNIFWEEWI